MRCGPYERWGTVPASFARYPHRTGHGIGMDGRGGHLVGRDDPARAAWFLNEPGSKSRAASASASRMLYDRGKDRLVSTPPPSIDRRSTRLHHAPTRFGVRRSRGQRRSGIHRAWRRPEDWSTSAPLDWRSGRGIMDERAEIKPAARGQRLRRSRSRHRSVRKSGNRDCRPGRWFERSHTQATCLQ